MGTRYGRFGQVEVDLYVVCVCVHMQYLCELTQVMSSLASTLCWSHDMLERMKSKTSLIITPMLFVVHGYIMVGSQKMLSIATNQDVSCDNLSTKCHLFDVSKVN